MHRILVLFCWLLISLAGTAAAVSAPLINTGTLLKEMSDLERLARWPEPAYKTVQFSSYDRRSTTSEAPGWFANADGFGREPIPGFMKVLREPDNGQPGLYLMAEVNGPGAIVRGWSAGMNGTLRVSVDPVDGDEKAGLIWQGKGYDFLARRSTQYLKAAGIDLDGADAFVQEDADYFPIPFARGLRVTWEGSLNELHFYHLQVRAYPPGTVVSSFDPVKDVTQFKAELKEAARNLTRPTVGQASEPIKLQSVIQPGASWTWSSTNSPAALRELKLLVDADRLDEALRGCLLRISFDGSQRPQVEAPVGDFFASGPGVNPFGSLPLTVDADGTMTCRFVMPFQKSFRLEVVNFTKSAVRLNTWLRLSSWNWDERSLYFRAKWRADHDLAARPAAMDLPYLLAIGKGVFVGCAAMIMNPSGVPTAGGNWWGEGDEKFLVDGEIKPSTFGTGSEDYFNYSWSRPDLFAHPYCGQPLDSGPDTSGYISNHRFQVMDAIPFEKSFSAYMELWTHGQVPGLSYARVAYHYARPGTVDDHRGLMPSDLRLIPIPLRKLQAAGGATGAKFHLAEELEATATAGPVETVPQPLATQLKVLVWQASKGAQLKLKLRFEREGKAEIHPVTVHQPGAATVRFLLDGKPLSRGENREAVELGTPHAVRVLNLNFSPVEAKAGNHDLVVECLEPGVVGLDYIWVKIQQER